MAVSITRRTLLAGSQLVFAGAAAGLMPSQVLAQSRPQSRSDRQIRDGLIRLSANENPYGPSASAVEALAEAIPDSWKYTVRQDQQLKKLIAAQEGVSPAHIMIGAGSGEILRIAALIYCRNDREVIAARPTFTFLQTYARNLGARVIEVDLDSDMRHDLASMASRVSAATGLVLVCNPNNPTGTMIEGVEMRPFISEVSRQTTVVVDEAYLDLSEDLAEHTAVGNVRAGENVIVSRTFSKLHGLAGLRIGYAIAQPETIKQFERYRMSILNIAGLRAAMASYQDRGFQQFSRMKIRESVELVYGACRDAGLAYVPSRGNFVLFDTGSSVKAFRAAMRTRGVLVGRSYAPYDSWCRVSMGTVEQMKVFADATQEYFKA